MRRALTLLTVTGVLLALPAPAGALVSANFEGQWLKTGVHTFWFKLTNSPGANPFNVCYAAYTGNYNSMSSLGCYTTNLGNGASAYFSYGLNITGADGSSRGVCAAQNYGGTTSAYVCSGSDNGKVEPKVDNTPPGLTLGVGGASEYTKTADVPVTILYQDATSPPWNKEFAINGETYLRTCVQQGADMNAVCLNDSQFVQASACAQTIVLSNGSKTANFNCNSTLTSDGKWWVCVRLTDSGRDNSHAGAAGNYGSTSTGGNLSEVCSYVTLDRAGPVIGTTTGTPGTAAPGQNVAFATSATDATSGVASYGWAFGDGATATGASVNHAYANAGSKTATLTVTDNAGNTSTKTVTTNVVAPDTTQPDTTITDGPPASTTATGATFSFTSTKSPATFECKLDAGSFAACTTPKAYSGLAVGSHTFSVRAKDGAGNQDPTPAARAWTIAAPGTDPGTGGGNGGNTGSGDSGSGGAGGGGDPGGGSGNSGAPAGVATDGSDAPAGGSAAGAARVVNQIGKARTRTQTVGGVTATVPRTVSLAKLKHLLPVLLKATGAGKVTLVLRRGARQLEHGALHFTKAGKAGFRLRLGRSLTRGGYLLDVTFTPPGSNRAAARTFNVRLRA